MNKEDTSWQKVGQWYDSIVGPLGHYYHRQIVMPGVLRLLSLQKDSSLLDLACGQGVLARHIPDFVPYTGVDLSRELVQKARTYHTGQKNRQFFVSDITKPLQIPKDQQFSHAACVLALQNCSTPSAVFKNIVPHLAPNGTFVFVINHPAFRIPRQSAWGFDTATKTQYRRLNGYMSPQKIPIASNPGQKDSESTLSFHFPLSAYASALAESHLYIETIEEWCSDKVSTGKAAKWENRARKEFPLFMAIKAKFL